MSSKRKRKAPDIVSGIPFDERETVKFVTVSKQKRRVTAVSTQISVPITPSFRAEEPSNPLPVPYTVECDAGVYSDAEEAATPPATQKADRKGPSRSVSVSPFLFQRIHFSIYLFDGRRSWRSG